MRNIRPALNRTCILREIGDFGGHTQKDQTTGEIIEITAKEAEWTLTVIDGLFDYFIVGPARDKQRRAEFDKKIEKAGRRSIKREESKS